MRTQKSAKPTTGGWRLRLLACGPRDGEMSLVSYLNVVWLGGSLEKGKYPKKKVLPSRQYRAQMLLTGRRLRVCPYYSLLLGLP